MIYFAFSGTLVCNVTFRDMCGLSQISTNETDDKEFQILGKDRRHAYLIKSIKSAQALFKKKILFSHRPYNFCYATSK